MVARRGSPPPRMLRAMWMFPLVAALVGFLLVFGRSRAVWNAYLIAAWITTFAVINNLYRLLS